MAAYKAKVTVITKGKEYRPGAILPADISSADLKFLKEKKFVELAEVPEAAFDEDDGDEEFDGFDEVNPGAVKSADEIRQIRVKKDVAAYATSIGLDLGDWNKKSLKVLQEEVINYQEEQLSQDDEENQEEGQGDGEIQGAGEGQDAQ